MRPRRQPSGRSAYKRLAKLVCITLLVISLPTNPIAFAVVPSISTISSITYGAQSPVIFISGVDFTSANDKFDFTVNMGITGLKFDSVAFVSKVRMRIVFHGIAKAGTITFQAMPSAFSPVPKEASNTILIAIFEPLKSQLIQFTNPLNMIMKDPDQSPKVVSTSSLAVSLISNSPSVCTINVFKFHAVSPGICSITATQSGDLKFASASPVTRSFLVLEMPVQGQEAINFPEDVLHLGSVSYDPKSATGAYISVLIASEDLNPRNATLVKLLVPPDATPSAALFVISSFSSDKENSEGYFVARITTIAADGSFVTNLNSAIELVLPAGAQDAVPAWSLDSHIWNTLSRIDNEVLPTGLHAGYFIEKDGSIAILSDYPMLLGFRKIQSPLKITSPLQIIKPNLQMQLKSIGGSGDGALAFSSATLDICSVSTTGVLTSLKVGECKVAVSKSASGVYLNLASSFITVYVESETADKEELPPQSSNSALCYEISYSILSASSQVSVDLCGDDPRKIATLEIGKKTKSGSWSYFLVLKQRLDVNGVVVFNLKYPLKNGEIVRVKVDGEFRISASINVN